MNASLPRYAATLASAAALGLAAAAAHADQPPAFTAGEVVAGPAEVGAPMRVVAQWTGVPAPSAPYEWERCDAAGLSCAVVEGACSASYVPTFDDFGHSLVARVDLWNAAGAVVARTPLSDLILGVPAAPASQPATACGTVATPVRPTPAQEGAPSAAPPGVGAPATMRPTYLRPFPVVRIRGYAVRGGARTAHAMRAMPAACCATSASSPDSDPDPILTPARRAHEDAERMYANGPERISPTAGPPAGGGLTTPSNAADHDGDPRSGPPRDARNCAGAGDGRCGAFAGGADRADGRRGARGRHGRPDPRRAPGQRPRRRALAHASTARARRHRPPRAAAGARGARAAAGGGPTLRVGRRARVRHRELYEAEYSWQELKLAALRQRIGAELANRAPGATGDPAPRPGGEEDARKPAEGQ